MNYTDIIDLLRLISKQHKLIKHSIGGRVSFFRMNDDGEIVNAQGKGITYPCCVVRNMRGNFVKSGDVSDKIYVEFDIRKKVNDLGDWAEIDAARSDCKKIGNNYIAKIEQLSEDGACGDIEDFEASDVSWEFIDATNLGEHGCRFRFSFTDTAYNQYTQDLDEIFVTEFYVPLLDFDGLPLLDWDDEPLLDLE